MKKTLARYSPLIILAGLCVLMAFSSSQFRTTGNLQNVAYRTSVVSIMATGQVLVILVAGIDLSVGSVAALAGMVACVLMKKHGVPVPLGIAAGVATGFACGMVNGILTAKGRIPPFIVTLGMMKVARGATLLLSGGLSVANLPDSFMYLGGAKAWWIPVAITVAITIFFSIQLTFTRFGRALFATGGNLNAARLSGINVDWVRIVAFTICGLLAGFAGVVLASRTSIAAPTAGEGYELDAIAACVIGGASLMGGEGGSIGTLAGALLMNVLVNFCNLKDLDPYWQQLLVGVLIIALVYYDYVRKRRAGVLKE